MLKQYCGGLLTLLNLYAFFSSLNCANKQLLRNDTEEEEEDVKWSRAYDDLSGRNPGHWM